MSKEVASSMDTSLSIEMMKRMKGRGKFGKKMIKAGIALIAVPDPITDVPGVMLVAAGYLAERFWSSYGFEDVSKELRKTMQILTSL